MVLPMSISVIAQVRKKRKEAIIEWLWRESTAGLDATRSDPWMKMIR